VKIRWNGHSSFSVIGGGHQLVTDPYEPKAFGGGIGYEAIDPGGVDLVTVSHDHADHNFVDPFKKAIVVTKAGTYKDVTFDVMTTFHDENQGKQRGSNRIFCFELEGIRICHLGDLGHRLSQNQIDQLGKVDVLFVPIGGYFTIDAKAANQIVDDLKPSITFPMHYKTSKCSFPIAEVESFLENKKHVKRINADEVEIQKETLPTAPETLVLKHRY